VLVVVVVPFALYADAAFFIPRRGYYRARTDDA
jgi:hypothetical protein